MAISQFTVYSSADRYAPQLTGTSGSLLAILDACLVNGYGSKTAAGWIKPFPNNANNTLGAFQQGSGSGLYLHINDAAPTGSTTSGARDAWATGWEFLMGLSGSGNSFTGSVGSGSGQFPLQSQVYATVANGALPSGSFAWRKSTTVDTTSRYWIMFADASTMYLFTYPQDQAFYHLCAFGDIFSLKSSADPYKVYITGKSVSMNAAGSTNDRFDPGDLISGPTQALDGWRQFVARGTGGSGIPAIVAKVGDFGKVSGNVNVTNPGGATTAVYSALIGVIPTPNTTDNSLYLSPIWISETSNGTLRGRLRGLWHMCHPLVNFSDGQIISGGNEYAGKSFQCVSPGPHSGMWWVEISPTVETNSI